MFPPRLGFLTCQQRIRWLCPAHFRSERDIPEKLEAPARVPGHLTLRSEGRSSVLAGPGAVGSASPRAEGSGRGHGEPCPGPALPPCPRGRPDPATHSPGVPVPSRTHRVFLRLLIPVAGCAPLFPSPWEIREGESREGGSSHTPALYSLARVSPSCWLRRQIGK